MEKRGETQAETIFYFSGFLEDKLYVSTDMMPITSATMSAQMKMRENKQVA